MFVYFKNKGKHTMYVAKYMWRHSNLHMEEELKGRHWSNHCFPVSSRYSLSVDELLCMIKFIFYHNIYAFKVAWSSVTRKSHNTAIVIKWKNFGVARMCLRLHIYHVIEWFTMSLICQFYYWPTILLLLTKSFHYAGR